MGHRAKGAFPAAFPAPLHPNLGMIYPRELRTTGKELSSEMCKLAACKNKF